MQLSRVAVLSLLQHALTGEFEATGPQSAQWTSAANSISVHLDEDGRLIDSLSIETRGASGTQRFSLSVRQPDATGLPENLADGGKSGTVLAHGILSCLPFKYEQAIVNWLMKNESASQGIDELETYIGSLIDLIGALEPTSQQSDDEPQPERFWIPLNEESQTTQYIAIGLKLNQYLQGILPPDAAFSWFLEDCGNIASRRPFAVMPRMLDRVEAGSIGPLELACYHAVFDLFGQPYEELVAEMALREFNNERVIEDLRSITSLLSPNPAKDADPATTEPTWFDAMDRFFRLDQPDSVLSTWRRHLQKKSITTGAYSDKRYTKLAAQHYARAMKMSFESAAIRLGLMYRYGYGPAVDRSKAEALFLPAAKNGNALAQYSLAWMYNSPADENSTPDYEQANEWFLQAAENGHTKAQLEYGYHCESGKGMEVDYVKAAKWYLAAAEQGNAIAQTNLGLAYTYARGVPEDAKEATKWFLKAAKQNNAKALYYLGWNYQLGDGIEQDGRAALDAYQQAADGGYAWAQVMLGRCHEYGIGVKADYTQAFDHYSAALEGKASNWATLHLARMHERGLGTPPNAEQAFTHYQTLSENDYGSGIAHLARCYADGIGTTVDQDLALQTIQRALKKKSSSAYAIWADFLCEGRITPQNFTEARKYYKLAADDYNALGYLGLARMSQQGMGVDADAELAVHYYRKAADICSHEADQALRTFE